MADDQTLLAIELYLLADRHRILADKLRILAHRNHLLATLRNKNRIPVIGLVLAT